MKRILSVMTALLLTALMGTAVFAAPQMVAMVEMPEEVSMSENDSDVLSITTEEKFVDVEYQVVATPHHCLAGYDATEEGFVSLALCNTSSSAVPVFTNIKAEKLGLSADEIDDCFLAVYTMKVTVDEKGKIAEISDAENKMVKKTVTDILLL